MSDPLTFRWEPNAKVSVFVLAFLPLTIGLGFWQLDRAEQKRTILAEQAVQQSLPALNNDSWRNSVNLHLRSFDLRVEFDPERWFLLDNRIRNGRPGYEVLGLAKAEGDHRWLIVNRGWVPASLNRNELPELEFPKDVVRIRGYFYQPDEDSFQLGQQSWTGGWPERVQYLDLDVMGERLAGETLLPASLRLAQEDPLAFSAGWDIVSQGPEIHTGYAVQWFALAGVLFIMGIFANSNLADLIRSLKRRN